MVQILIYNKTIIPGNIDYNPFIRHNTITFSLYFIVSSNLRLVIYKPLNGHQGFIAREHNQITKIKQNVE